MMEELLPPWLKHPEIPFGSIGWRMGYGEDYWHRFDTYYASLGSGGRKQFRDRHPEPAEWEGFYARKRGR